MYGSSSITRCGLLMRFGELAALCDGLREVTIWRDVQQLVSATESARLLPHRHFTMCSYAFLAL